MKTTMTLGELQTRHVQLKSVAASDAIGYEKSRAIHALARYVKQALLGYKLPDGTLAEDFLDSSSALQKRYNALETKAFEESAGSPDKQRYLLNQFFATDATLKEMKEAQEAFWKSKVEFKFEPICVDLSEIEKAEKYNNRLDDKYEYSFDRVWPKSVPVDWRGNQISRNPKQDFMDLEEEGFIVTEKVFFELADSEAENFIQRANKATKTINKK